MQRIERALLNLAASGGLLVFATAGEAALSGRIARAERVESRREARVFASPGESSRVVTRVRPGKEMQVLQRRNRWLRVRVNGRTGWITRTNVIPVELVEAAPRRTRRYPFVEGRGVRRDGPSSAPRDRVGADATDAGSVDDAGELAPRERRRAALQRGKAIHRRAVDDVAADPAAVVDGPATRGELDGEEVEERFDVRIRPQARDEAGEAGAPEAADDTAVDDAFDPPVHATARDEADGPRAALARPDRPRHLEATKAREVVVVKVDEAVLRAEPSPSSALVASAESGTRLLVLERVGTWIKVQRGTGESGWLRESRVEAGSTPRAGGDVVATDARPGARTDRLARRASVGLGYSAIAQRFHSNSDDPRGTYRLSSGAAVVGAGGELVHDEGDRWLFAADLAYRYSQATPGIHYTDPDTMSSVNIGFKRHQLDVGGRAGYRLGAPDDVGAVVGYGRLGFHYDNLRIDDVDDFERNLARLPSEVLTGVTVGALVDVPHLGAGWAARVEIETLPLLAGRKQTAGLEDGAASTTTVAWGGAQVQYAWDETYRVTGEYQYAYAKTTWRGTAAGSMRPHMADSARRKDSTHVLLIGVGRSF